MVTRTDMSQLPVTTPTRPAAAKAAAASPASTVQKVAAAAIKSAAAAGTHDNSKPLLGSTRAVRLALAAGASPDATVRKIPAPGTAAPVGSRAALLQAGVRTSA